LVLAALIADVTCLKPTKTPQLQSGGVAIHQSAKNYIVAKKLIAKLLPSPAGWWSPPIVCGEAGRGIWLAQGAVDTASSSEQEVATRWIAIFIPENSQPLYLRLGSREVGNFTTALAQAGIHAKTR
jgi:hypothetical protein